jgi:EAL domain-containing protein (putative c-di-GMP-specific phosphodiesterase class I)
VFLQPIVSLQGRQVIAYESLARGRLFGVDKPETMFRAACFLHQEIELSELMRDRSLAVTMPDRHLFLNTHPNELKDLKRLLRSIVKLRQTNPDRPITMEVHEAAIADITTLQALRFALDDLQIGLAFDDFGAGQARIMELENVRPHCLKFDMQMIRGLDRATNSHIKMLRSLVTITRDLGICPLAEGIETDAEARACLDVGFALGQGFLFGHPEAALFR